MPLTDTDLPHMHPQGEAIWVKRFRYICVARVFNKKNGHLKQQPSSYRRQPHRGAHQNNFNKFCRRQLAHLTASYCLKPLCFHRRRIHLIHIVESSATHYRSSGHQAPPLSNLEQMPMLRDSKTTSRKCTVVLRRYNQCIAHIQDTISKTDTIKNR